MATRDIDEKRRSWLASEVEAWRAQGLVSSEQATGILALYGTSEERAARRHSKGMLVLMAVAAFLVGLGVFLLIGYNWEEIPIPGKLVLIFGSLLGVHGLGWHLRFNKGRAWASEIAFFMGGLLYGAGIMLVAQIFHINAHYPDGIWWWALGVLPLALILETPLLQVLLVALLVIWCGTEIIGDPARGDWLFGRPPAIPNGAYTLPLLVLPGLAWAYRRKSVLTIQLYVPLIAWWAILQPIAWHSEWDAIHVVGVIGAGLLMISQFHAEDSPFVVPYRYFGALLTAGTFVPLSFHEFVHDMERHSHGKAIIGTVILAAIVLIVPVLLGARRSGRTGPPDWAALVRRAWMPAAIVFTIVVIQCAAAARAGEILGTLLANLAMIALAFWLIQTGLREDRGRPFAAGVLYFLLWAVLRYVDLFANVGGMIGAAMMFFLCGGSLFGVALYWRRRKARVA